ncbi:MAG: SMC-Scp complex subunit ScpB [Saprospiraceae bacterium]
MKLLEQHIESLIFSSEHPISFEDIQACLDEVFETSFKVEVLEEAIEQLMARYQADVFSFEIVEISKGYQFLSKGAYFNTIATYLKQTTKKKLSKAALETLALVAYKQPVSKGEMEKIRGVSCDYSIQKLLEKELVTISGRSDGPGRPLLYATSEKFMDYFGIKSLTDLPKPKDFKMPDNEIGESAPIEELNEINNSEEGAPNEETGTAEETEAGIIEVNGNLEESLSSEVITAEESDETVVTEDLPAESVPASTTPTEEAQEIQQILEEGQEEPIIEAQMPIEKMTSEEE